MVLIIEMPPFPDKPLTATCISSLNVGICRHVHLYRAVHIYIDDSRQIAREIIMTKWSVSRDCEFRIAVQKDTEM